MQQQNAKQAADKEIAELEKQLLEIPITKETRVELDTEKALEATVKSSVNAKKNKAAQELNHWRDRHLGPTWTNAKLQYVKYSNIAQKLATLEKARTSMDYSVEERRVRPVVDALRAWEAFESGDAVIPKLSAFGVLATEFNEGNSLLLAKLYESQILKSATLPEIVAVLGAFIVDRESQEKTVHPRSLKISECVTNALLQIDLWGQEGYKIDTAHGVSSPAEYWSLATLWTQIGYEWVQGADAASLSKTYEIYEGNLMRGLLKLYSLVNEWITAATFKADVDMLLTMKDAQQLMLRDIAQPESLYLRL
jgi:superfamily II RNA helicase